MDVLTFLSSVVASLAWPVSVLAIAAVLRGSVRQMVPLLRKAKYKDLELEFGRKLDLEPA